jgi:DNA mismatch repair ATPase MutS
MKAHLLYKDQDFCLEGGLPGNVEELVQDLDLTTLFETMAQGDAFLFDVSKRVILSSLGDPETITYRQRILADCIANPETIREMYAIAVDAIVGEKKARFWGFYSKHPSAILRSAVDTLDMFMGLLKRLRRIADEQAGGFESDGLTVFFGMLAKELDDDYLQCIDQHLAQLRLQDGMLSSAELGRGGKGVGYTLLAPGQKHKQSLKERMGIAPRSSYSFDIHPRDVAGGRALRELTDRGLNYVADALAQSKDHILSFFDMLRLELGFYVGCLNLYDKLSGKGEPVCVPVPLPQGRPALSFRGLYSVCLTVKTEERVVGNDADADGKSLVMITGANSGGKSTFLRGIGVAKLMMQCGMFVGAESFRANICDRLFTHFIREEDESMVSGRFDEELSRMSAIAGEITPHSIMLFNESFAATNEREGSEIARQVVRALLESGIKVLYVTHLFTLADDLYRQEKDVTLFLRAERGDNGRRSFKIIEGMPLPTSFGEDIYRRLGGWSTVAKRSTPLRAASTMTGPCK